MAKVPGYTIQGPPLQEHSPPHPLHKSLPIRRDTKGGASDLRTLFRHSADYTDIAQVEEPTNLPNGVPETPKLPPTPPTPPAVNGHASKSTPDDDATEGTQGSSKLTTPVTPTNPQSPPTPDNTPPRERKLPFLRPFLGTQVSLVSTRAESFKTAREDVASDDDGSIFYGHDPNLSTPKLPTLHDPVTDGAYSAGPSALRRSPILSQVTAEDSLLPTEREIQIDEDGELNGLANEAQHANVLSKTPPQATTVMSETKSAPRQSLIVPTADEEGVHIVAPKSTAIAETKRENLRRGPSLRDRLEAADKNSPSASVERFANIIGWTNTVGQDDGHTDKRLSGVSTTSTISAMVFQSSPLPRRRTTLRKKAKTDSLRAASSPLPASKRFSTNSSSDSPHQLHHKKARLSNENRLSFGSDPSPSFNLSSSTMPPKAEVIRVAVIPERSSSLQSSAHSSRRHSLSSQSAKTHSRVVSEDPHKPPSSWQRKRTLSESVERAKEQGPDTSVQPPVSSLSVPTSRSASYSNPRTSDHYRSQRKKAETDLRKTLDRMESDRLVSSLRGVQEPGQGDETPSKGARQSSQSSTGTVTIGILPSHLPPPTPGTTEWAALRPPSTLETPFSQPSYQSASPEINEATAVNLFPHNNTSLQIIEPVITQESRAVKEVRKPQYIKDDTALTQSPLRNPRQPPEPPQFQAQVIPPSPIGEADQQLDAGMPARFGSMSRPIQPKRGDSLLRTLSRGLSLKNTRNRKRGEADGTLSPFWKPKGFWDDVRRDGDMQSDDEDEAERDLDLNQHRGVMNSLGIPQERTVITGPVSLVRRLSERRRQNRERVLVSKSSTSSLGRLRASRKLYKTNILGLSFRFMGLRDIRDQLLYARHRREQERREQRRQELRGKIGNEIVRVGDSRFPASDISLNF